jgi:transcriptional regulator with XRE-family HTH domain
MNTVNHTPRRLKVFGMRLRTARLKLGLSQRGLSEKTGKKVSHNAIAKYERGLMMPQGDVLCSIAKALEVSTDFFWETHLFSPTDLCIPERPGLTRKTASSLADKILRVLSLELELDRRMGQAVAVNLGVLEPTPPGLVVDAAKMGVLEPTPPGLVADAAKMGVLESTPPGLDAVTARMGVLEPTHPQLGADAAAERFRERLGIGLSPVISVTGLLENLGIKIIGEKSADQWKAISGWVHGKGTSASIPFIITGTGLEAEEIRMSMLQEAGRLFLQPGEGLSPGKLETWYRNFAAAVLIPEAAFYSETGKKRDYISVPEFVRLKEIYGISVRELLRRARNLQVIGQDEYRFCCMRISANPREDGLGFFCGRESTDRFRTMVFRAAAEKVLLPAKAAALLGLHVSEFKMDSRIF